MSLRTVIPVLRNIVAKQSLGNGLRCAPRLSALCSYSTSSNETVKLSSVLQADAENSLGLIRSRELGYFHGVMERLVRYQDSVFTEEMIRAELCDPGNFDIEVMNAQDWNALPDEEVVEAFRKLTSYAVSRNMAMGTDFFTPVCNIVKERLGDLSTTHLVVVGKLFCLWRSEYTNDQYHNLFADALDSACIEAYRKCNRNFNLILQLLELWYWSSRGHLNHFLRFSLNNCLLKAREPQHILQFFFYLNIMGNLPPTYKIFPLQRILFRVNPVSSLDELAFATLGFHRRKKRLEDRDLVKVLLKRMREEAYTINSYTLSAICKSITYTVEKDSKVDIIETQKVVTQRVDELPFVSFKHLWFLGFQNKSLNEEFTHAVYNGFLVNLTTLWVKDLCFFLHSFSASSLDCNDLKVLAERVNEFIHGPIHSELIKNPSLYTFIILQLMVSGSWPFDLVGNLLNAVRSDNVKDFSHNTLCIDILMEVFYPDRTDVRLSAEHRKLMHETLCDESKEPVDVQKKTEWVDLLKSAVGNRDDFLKLTRIIPTAPMDVVLCVDKTGSIAPVPEQLLQYEAWEIKKIPECVQTTGGKLIAILFDSSNPNYLKKIPEHQSFLQHHRRGKQMTLEKLGYQVHVIRSWEKEKTMVLEELSQLIPIKNPPC